jgi:hypothetical protein
VGLGGPRKKDCSSPVPIMKNRKGRRKSLSGTLAFSLRSIYLAGG